MALFLFSSTRNLQISINLIFLWESDLIEDGKKVVQETRRWDDDKEYSYPMRSKEDAQDYRYFPEPDLAPIVISDEWLDEIRSRQPEFRDEKQARYKEQFGLPEYDINIITEDKTLTDFGLFATISSITFRNAPSSFTVFNPFSST